jgi:hypothetical protein
MNIGINAGRGLVIGQTLIDMRASKLAWEGIGFYINILKK